MVRRSGLVSLLLAQAACNYPASPHAFVPADASSSRDAGTSGTPAGTDTLTIMDQGRARVVIVHLPSGRQGPMPLVFNLHGSGGTAADQRSFVNMDQAADAYGFIVAYPQGAILLGGGFAWNVPGQPLSGGGAVPPDAADDVAFFARAIAFIAERYPVDLKRVYVSGFSGGGRMTSQLGCDLSTVVAAVAPVAGLRFPSPCMGIRPMPVVAFHGTADTTNPYDGGGPDYWTYGVPSAAQQWGAFDGCGATPGVSVPAAGVELTSYSGCREGAVVNLYTIAGAGHEWPGAPSQTSAIDATSVMWSFFAARPLP